MYGFIFVCMYIYQPFLYICVSMYLSIWASLVAQIVKNLPAMQETWVQSLGWEDPMEKGMAIHSSILAQRIPCTGESGELQFMGLQRVRHDWMTITHTHTHTHTSIYRLARYICQYILSLIGCVEFLNLVHQHRYFYDLWNNSNWESWLKVMI